MGLRAEADLLSELSRHENIVRLYAISSNMYEDPTEGFLVLELLTETLTARLERWKQRKLIGHKQNKHFSALFTRRKEDTAGQGVRIANIGVGLAQGMAFLHKNKILYRDLKPQNVGFSSSGNVRIFDFGLARKLDATSIEERRLTFQVGSLRYMSPEVFRGGATYDFSTDVHSFAILLWEIITLETAFHKAHNVKELSDMAFYGKQRPSLKLVDSSDIRSLLKACWDPSPELRPSFAPIVFQLQASSQAKNKGFTLSRLEL